jgi:hypothetical protein
MAKFYKQNSRFDTYIGENDSIASLLIKNSDAIVHRSLTYWKQAR